MGDTFGTIGRIGAGIGTFGTSELANAASGGKLYDGVSNAVNGGGKGGPATPDFAAAAREQSAQSHANQSNPFASSTWSQDPSGRWSQNTQLAPGLQGAATGLEGQVAGLSQPMDWSQFGPVQTGDQARDQAINAAYGQATSRLDPQWQQREQGLTAQLANQGLSPMDEAGGNALANLGRERNDAYTSAMNSAIGQGTEAGNAAFRNNMLARQTSIANALQQRGQPLSELQQIQGFTQGMQQPGAATGPNLLGAMGSQYQGDLQRYGINQQGKNSTMGGLASLAPLAFL